MFVKIAFIYDENVSRLEIKSIGQGHNFFRHNVFLQQSFSKEFEEKRFNLFETFYRIKNC